MIKIEMPPHKCGNCFTIPSVKLSTKRKQKSKNHNQLKEEVGVPKKDIDVKIMEDEERILNF